MLVNRMLTVPSELKYLAATLFVSGCSQPNTFSGDPPSAPSAKPELQTHFDISKAIAELSVDVGHYKQHAAYIDQIDTDEDNNLTKAFFSCALLEDDGFCHPARRYYKREPALVSPVLRLGEFYLDGTPTPPHCGTTLIEEDAALTAAHCATYTSPEGNIHPIAPKFISVQNSNGDVFEVQKVSLHPNYARKSAKSNKGDQRPHYDVAVIHLKEPVTDIIPIPFSSHPPTVGNYYTKVGRAGKNHIMNIDPACPMLAHEYYNDFKCTSDKGDSGGPLLGFDNGKLEVFGIISHGGRHDRLDAEGPNWETINQFLGQALCSDGEPCAYADNPAPTN